jgi:hypothetical protein
MSSEDLYLKNYKIGANLIFEKVASITKIGDRALYEAIADYASAIPAAVIRNFQAKQTFKAAKKAVNPVKKINLLLKSHRLKMSARRHKRDADNLMKYFNYLGSVGGAAASLKALQLGISNKGENQKINERVELMSQGVKTLY